MDPKVEPEMSNGASTPGTTLREQIEQLQVYEADWGGALDPEAFSGDKFVKLADVLAVLAERPQPIEQSPNNRLESMGLIPLNEAQQVRVKEWAADDRLWTTQETVEINLRTFARLILKEQFLTERPAETTAEVSDSDLESFLAAYHGFPGREAMKAALESGRYPEMNYAFKVLASFVTLKGPEKRLADLPTGTDQSALARVIAERIAGSSSGEALRQNIAESLLTFPAVTRTVAMLAAPAKETT